MPRGAGHILIVRARRIWKGLSLCLFVTTLAYFLEAAEWLIFGKIWLEALVLAILSGMAIRTFRVPSNAFQPGIVFSARYLLEMSVVLLGATVSAASLLSVGPALVAGIVVLVGVSLISSFGIGRLLGLPCRMALLVACGNSICGNSAIAAVAPIIRADGEEVASSIAFTAVLGVFVVLGLPFFGVSTGMSGGTFGAFAGLTVYAVPQVVAATAPLGLLAVQTGTVVKLVRVLMLGPVCFGLSLLAPLLPQQETTVPETGNGASGVFRFVPWFIVGFLGMVCCRSIGLFPASLIVPVSQVATFLTVVSMGALGLGVDMRSVVNAGPRVTCTVVLSLLMLGSASYGLLVFLSFG
ncbi:YeiH family protein [Gluconobacter japonicus]|uniref:YeiH family protein n=1 Tax=Gluconobacter japonicus TaxID=376620 RepID=UPI0024AE55E0|nr:putative sulfate exporter family transporter [Gluconobacter japonicus]